MEREKETKTAEWSVMVVLCIAYVCTLSHYVSACKRNCE